MSLLGGLFNPLLRYTWSEGLDHLWLRWPLPPSHPKTPEAPALANKRCGLFDPNPDPSSGQCVAGEPFATCFQHADLKINLAYSRWNQAGVPNPAQYDLYSAFVHEFGHGLSAPDVSTPCSGDSGSPSMCGTLPVGAYWARTLASADVTAYVGRYGNTH